MKFISWAVTNRKFMIPVFIVTIIAIGLLYDFFLLKTGGVPFTISAWVSNFFSNHNEACFLFGFLCGHLTWQMGIVKPQ